MGFILSVSTIPTRINNLIRILHHTTNIRYKYFIINLCVKYKRFGEFKIPKELIMLCKSNKRIIFNIVDDFGPINKYIGAFQKIKKLKHNKDDKIIIIDDDTVYHPDLFYELMDAKTKDNVTTGSGFNYDENRNYKIVEGKTDMVEGYGGILFDIDQCSDFIFWFVKFYLHFNFKQTDVVSKYLQAAFLGDDFILSNIYPQKFAIKEGRKYIKPQPYGFQDDALHKNNVFGNNMESYKHLYDNIKVLETFKNKFELNKAICSLESQN
jgi:hypothetical protein